MSTAHIQELLGQLRTGDQRASDALIEAALEKIRERVHDMLWTRLRTLNETGDVVNEAVIALRKSLLNHHPATVDEFIGLACQHIRWVLGTLSKKQARRSFEVRAEEPESLPGPRSEPANELAWAEFHERVGDLPPGERTVFEHIYYFGLQQEEVAAVLGVSVKTVQRRFRDAKIRLEPHDPRGG